MKNIKKLIEKYNLIKKGETIGVGVSGGKDSMALLNYLNEIKFDYGFDVIAITIDHSIREASKGEVKFVEDFCNKNGIRVDIGAENTFGAHLYASAGDFFAFNKKLVPNTTNSLGLGDTSNKWSSLYTNTSVNIGSCTQTYNALTKSLVYSFE